MQTHYVYHHRKSNKVVTLRHIDLQNDLDCLVNWMGQAHVIPNWQLNKPKEELFKHFEEAIKDAHQILHILSIDGKELCYAETYYAPQDRLAQFCDIQAGDYGIHLLIGPPDEIGKGHSEALLCALTDYLFQHHRARRVLVEPNYQVKQLTILERKLGFINQGLIQLPEKMATLYAAEPHDFYKIECDTRAWPLVKIHFPNHPHDMAVKKWLQQVDQLLQCQEPCIVIATFDPHYQFSTEARRYQALWFKKNKLRLEAYCLGMFRVTQDQKMIEKITSNAMRQGMPFTCTPVSSLEEAEKIAQNQLQQYCQKSLCKQKNQD